jgi:tetratricopeptide (TPR) repeat protein
MRQETVESTRRAIALMPDQAEYYARLAFLAAGTDPRTARDALRRAVALNPWDAQSWIELGLSAEAEGDAATSLQCLLRAAEVDKKFLPRWSLANYYFRHDDVAMFWFWSKQAAVMVNGDALPMFRLCGKVEEDGKLIDRLEIRNPGVRAGYLSYLLDQNRVDLIAPAVHRLLQENREADVPLLSAACERLLQAGRVPQAAEIWNRLADAPNSSPMPASPCRLHRWGSIGACPWWRALASRARSRRWACESPSPDASRRIVNRSRNSSPWLGTRHTN